MAIDFYATVPTDLVENLEFRLELRRRAAKDYAFRRQMWAACEHDVLFWLSGWVWLYEPRTILNPDGIVIPQRVPFIPWAHQVQPIRDLRGNLGKVDIGLEKSRAQGASWIAVLLALHDWLFRPMKRINMVSQTEELVDDPDSPDSLMWKLDFALKTLPEWMAGTGGKDKDWVRNRNQHSLTNNRNGSSIKGYACGPNVARGGRCSWFLMDELASWADDDAQDAIQNTSRIGPRLFISTPFGNTNPYARMMHEDSSMVKIVLDWKDHPWQNRGLYRHVDGKMVAMDPVRNPLLPNYEKDSAQLMYRLRQKGFKLAGEIRSPWYDRECDKPIETPYSIARELDRDYGGSKQRFFGPDFMTRAKGDVRKPVSVGRIDFLPSKMMAEFEKHEGGQVLLWAQLDNRGSPQQHPYVVAVDPSHGTGGSYSNNSVLTVFDVLTKEQVLEWATNTVPPPDFAEFTVAVCNWFHNAFLIWEMNGPGIAFWKRIRDLNYSPFFRRPEMSKQRMKRSTTAGWWSSPKEKKVLFEEFSRGVRRGEIQIRSSACVRECEAYVFANGRIENEVAASAQDESGKGESHGDRVVASALAAYYLGGRKEVTDKVTQNTPPPGSMEERDREYAEALRLKEDAVWDHRQNWDLMNGGRVFRGGDVDAMVARWL